MECVTLVSVSFRADPLSNMELNFDTKEDAVYYCEKHCKLNILKFLFFFVLFLLIS